MKIVEFTGIPGSGKSTILPIVKDYLANQGLTVFDSGDIVRCSTRFPFTNSLFNTLLSSLPRGLNKILLRKLNNGLCLRQKYQIEYMINNLLFFNSVADLTNSRPIPENHKRITIESFLRMAGDYQIAKESSKKNAVLLLDEGFGHKVITFYISVEEKIIDFVEIESYLEKIPRIHLLIEIKADESVCKKRIIDRKLPERLEGRTDHEVMEYLRRSKSAIDYGVKYLSTKGVKVETLVNPSESFCPEEIISQLSNKIGEFA